LFPDTFYKVNGTTRKAVEMKLSEVEAPGAFISLADDSDNTLPITLLHVSASPHADQFNIGMHRLRVDAEVRDIEHRLRASTNRSAIRFQAMTATRVSDLIDGINRFSP